MRILSNSNIGAAAMDDPSMLQDYTFIFPAMVNLFSSCAIFPPNDKPQGDVQGPGYTFRVSYVCPSIHLPSSANNAKFMSVASNINSNSIQKLSEGHLISSIFPSHCTQGIFDVDHIYVVYRNIPFNISGPKLIKIRSSQ